jgi:hypothetical protein
VKQHQKDVEKHADITDKAGFHRLVKRKMTTSKGHENATGASGVATAKTGTIDISLTSADFKIDSPAEKLFDRVFEIVKKWDTDKTTQISTAARKELFSILGFPDNQFDIYPNRCTAKGTDVFKIVKLVLFKSVGTGKVFPSVGYRFFHASDKPDIAKTGLIPSLGSTHGFIDQKTGKPTINRSYNKKACFFMAIKNNESLIYNIIDKAFRYGDYLYEYKPKRGDVFYEDLFSRPGHTSVMKDLLNIPGVIPVFINSNTPLPVKRIDKNIENRLLDRDKKVVKDTISSSNDTMHYISAEHKKFKQQSERLIKILETVKSQIKSANTTSELYEALWEFLGVSDLRVDACDDKCYEIIKNSDKNDNIDSIKNKIIDVITKYQENIINDNKSNRNYLYQQRYKPLKRYIDNQRQEIQDIDRKLKSHKNHPAFESYIDETIERFDAFMEEFNHGQIGDSEFIMESVQDNEYSKIVRDYIKKSGRRYFKYKRGEDHLPKEVEDKIFDLAKKIVEFPPNGDYSQYKMYYQSFCRIVNYPIDTVIMGMMINDAHNGYINMGALGRYRGAKRCVLKPGTHLFHSSDNPNLTMINPNHFKGKPNNVKIGGMEIPTGDYDSYYACPRIYFHVEKMGSRVASAYGTVKYDSNNMPIIENKPTSGHMYMYIVKPTDRIFFDPELNSTNDKDGAVYMLIDKPVKLTKIY